MSSLLNTLNKTAGIASSAASSLATDYSSAGNQLAVYVADISKGILIVVVGGLAAGIGFSLVSGWGCL